VPPVTSLPARALEKIKLVIKNKSYIFAVEISEYFSDPCHFSIAFYYTFYNPSLIHIL